MGEKAIPKRVIEEETTILMHKHGCMPEKKKNTSAAHQHYCSNCSKKIFIRQRVPHRSFVHSSHSNLVLVAIFRLRCSQAIFILFVSNKSHTINVLNSYKISYYCYCYSSFVWLLDPLRVRRLLFRLHLFFFQSRLSAAAHRYRRCTRSPLSPCECRIYTYTMYLFTFYSDSNHCLLISFQSVREDFVCVLSQKN